MQEASLAGLIKTILIMIVVYYIFKFIFKYVLPILLVRYVEKRVSQMNPHNQNHQKSSVKEGTTIIDKKPQTNQPNHTYGEYVDYEEVE